MSLFGGSSSKSYSTTLMQDQRVIAEEAEILAGAGAGVNVSLPASFLLGAPLVSLTAGRSIQKTDVDVGDIDIQYTLQEYTPLVAQTVSELIETVQLVSTQTIPVLAETFGDAIARTSDAGMRATDILGEKLQETQLGQAAILPGVAKFLLIAVAAILIAGKVWK